MDFHHLWIAITLGQSFHGALPNNADGLRHPRCPSNVFRRSVDRCPFPRLYFSQISRGSTPSALQEVTIPSAPSLIRSAAHYLFIAFPYALRLTKGISSSLMICLGERHQFATYNSLQIATLSCHTGSSAVSPISRAHIRSHPLNFSTSSVRCLHLRILSFDLVTCAGENQMWTNCAPR